MGIFKLLNSVIRVAEGRGMRPTKIVMPVWMHDDLERLAAQYCCPRDWDGPVRFRGVALYPEAAVDEPVVIEAQITW